MTFAARVGFTDGGELSPWLQVCLRGEGTAGAVGLFTPVVRRRDVAGGAKPLAVAAGAWRVGEGDLAGKGADVVPLAPEEEDIPLAGAGGAARGGIATRWDVEDCASSPTRRLFVSVTGFSGDSFSRVGWDWERPNPGDWYRLRGRELPPPRHR